MPSPRGRYSRPFFAASTVAAAVTADGGNGPLTSTGRSSARTSPSLRFRTNCISSATRRNRSKSETWSRCGPLAEAAFGTPLSPSTQSRNTVATGQLVSTRKWSVSADIGVRNFWTASPLSEGMSVKVGRFAPLTLMSGRTDVNVPERAA